MKTLHHVVCLGPVTALALSLTLLGPSPTRANPLDYFGFGPRGIAMGSAQTALADDITANYYNPAGLVLRDALQLQLGYTHIDPTLTLNGQDLEVDGVYGFQGGLLVPGDVFGHRLAVSLGVHLPNERITRLRALPESQPRFALYDNHPQRLVLTTSLAFEIVPEILSVGVGLTYLSDTRGRLNVTGEVDLLDAAGTELIAAVDVDFSAVRYPSFGVMFTPHPRLRVGLAYREEFDLTLDLGVIVTGDIVTNGATSPIPLVEGARLEVTSTNTNLFSPRQLTLGLAWLGEEAMGGRPCFSVTAELGWYQWSRMRSPTALLSTELDAGSLPLSIPPNPTPTAPGFSDILIPRIGYEQAVVMTPNVSLFVRAGAFYEPSPAPAQTGVTNFVDGDKLGFGFGLALGLADFTEVFPRPLWIEVSALGTTMFERRHDKTDPADPTGDYLSSGDFFGLSSSLRFEF